MTIINRSMFPLQQGFRRIKSMQARLDQLQVQLGTGKRHQTLADYGNQRHARPSGPRAPVAHRGLTRTRTR